MSGCARPFAFRKIDGQWKVTPRIGYEKKNWAKQWPWFVLRVDATGRTIRVTFRHPVRGSRVSHRTSLRWQVDDTKREARLVSLSDRAPDTRRGYRKETPKSSTQRFA